MNITVVGAGYVGLSLAILIAQKYNVTIFDTDQSKIDLINKKISPIQDKDITKYLSNKKISLKVKFFGRIYQFFQFFEAIYQ